MAVRPADGLPRPGQEPALRPVSSRPARRPAIASTTISTAPSRKGFGRYDFTIRRGKRCSTSKAFLRPILDRPNLTVMTQALTRKLLVENRKAVGVELVANGESRRIGAGREIVLAAGAVNSPQLLMLSGIGDAEELRQHGIAVVHHLPGRQEPAGPCRCLPGSTR